MRTSALFTAAFAAAAFATPVKRQDVVVETDTAIDVTYVTDIVTVTAAEETAAATTVEAAASATTKAHWGHHSWHSSSVATSVATSAAAPSSSAAAPPAPESSSSAAAPSSYSAPSTSAAAPAPASTSAAASSAASSMASSTSSASTAVASTYQEAVIVHHNLHRANHSATALTWDADLASTALSIAQTCVYAHNVTAGGGGYGQNIAAGVDNNNISAVITDLFYNAEVGYYADLYGQESPDMTNFEKWGHFSQIVWKGTTTVGCATYDCSSAPGGLANTDGTYVQPYFTVCNYGPPGNYAGEYGTNIGDSLNQASIEWHDEVNTSSFD